LIEVERMSKVMAAALALGLGILTACRNDVGSSLDKATGVGSTGAQSALDDGPDLAIVSALGITTSIRGVSFVIKSQIDNNFCIESQNGAIAGRTVTLQICGGSDFQRWGLPLFSNQTNIIIDQEGFCLDGHFSNATLGAVETVEECQAGGRFHFAVLPTGQIQNVKNQKCLQVPGAASNASVSLANCDATKLNQLWSFTH
jgi:hypothetical protein